MEGWDQVLNECGTAASGIGGGSKGQEKAKKGSARIPCGQGGKAKLGRELVRTGEMISTGLFITGWPRVPVGPSAPRYLEVLYQLLRISL